MSGRNAFIERSLEGALAFFKEALFSQEYAASGAFLQAIDPRIKIISFLLFVAAAVLLRNIWLIILLYLFCLLLVVLSRIELAFFLKRTLIFIPLFSFFIILPALFHIVSPGEPLFSFRAFGLTLSITRPGLSSALLFLSRILTTVSFVVLLGLSTRHTQLLCALAIFKVPLIFIMVINMCYRYLYLFVELIEKIYLAVKSRVGGNLGYKQAREIIGLSMASLWQRSYQLNNQVYNAMLSRGYRGEPRVMDEFRAKTQDWVWLFSSLAIFIFLIYLNSFS